MNELLVYRLETYGDVFFPNGIGVYQRGGVAPSPEGKPHPAPWEDSRLSKSMADDGLPTDREFYGKVKFGFESIEQMRTWFYDDEWLNKMHEGHVVLTVYRVTKIYRGNSQVCFPILDHVESNVKERISLDTLTEADKILT